MPQSSIAPSWMDRLFDTRPKRTKDVYLPSEADIGKHPIGLKEGALEKLIKQQALKKGTIVEKADMPYLEQYLHPEHNVLPKQELRPTKGGPDRDNLEYRHMYSEMDMRPDPESVKKTLDEFGKGTIHKIDYSKMKHTPQRWYDSAGLGMHKFDTSHPDYDSIFDIWDFDTKSPLYAAKSPREANAIGPSMDSMIKAFMQRVGKPYKVYERIPKGVHDPQ